MKQVTPEAGILRVLQLTALGELLIYPTLRRYIGVSIGNEPSLSRWLVVVLTGPLLLLCFTGLPWFRQRLGSIFLPAALTLFSVYALVDKYVTLIWFTPPPLQELNAVLFMVRVWLLLQIVTGIIATHYHLAWVFLIGLVLSLVDGALSLAFISRDSDLYP